MHKYLEYAKNKIEGLDGIIKENLNERGFLFTYNERLFSFSLYNDFPHSLPEILTVTEDTSYPHFIKGDNVTRICFGRDDDFNLYDTPGDIIIEETLDSFFSLINLSPYQQKKEFFKEFLHFWHKSSKKNMELKTYINNTFSAKEVQVTEILRDKVGKIAKFKSGYIKSESDFVNSLHLDNGTNKKGIFIPLINISYLSPFPNEWNFRKILNKNINEDSYLFLKSRKTYKKSLHFLFSLSLETGFEIQFLSEITFLTDKIDTIYNKLVLEIEKIEPILSFRNDVTFMLNRTSGETNLLNKKIAIIGCGSLGSYIANEIPKLGIGYLKLYDSDKIHAENIFRHTLGGDFIGFNKTDGLKASLSASFPHLKIEPSNKKVNYKNIVQQGLEKLDLVIFSIGSSSEQLLINDKLREIKFKKPVLFTWLDSFGSGCHALLVDYSKKGCYKCLSKFKVSFSKNNDDIVHTDGCGGTFTPYGNSILLKGTSMVLDVITHFFSNRQYPQNPLFSVKNIKQDSIEYTDRYLKNSDDLFEVYDYIDEGCGCCGN